MGAARGFEMLRIAKVDQRVEALNRLEDDIAALPAIAAVGAAIFDIFLAPEADPAGTAAARFEIDLSLVEKMHRRFAFVAALERTQKVRKGVQAPANRRQCRCRNVCGTKTSVFPDEIKHLVEPSGIEPLTSSLRTTRSPN